MKRNVIIALVASFALVLGGCGFIKDKLQSGVDDLNKGIEDTAKSVGEDINSGVKETTDAVKEEFGTTGSGEEKAEEPAVTEPATEAAPK